MKLKHDTWVVVADGGKYLLLRNRGDAQTPALKVILHDEIDNPPDQMQSSDRPGRMSDPSSARSALEETDWHRVGKQQFAAELADRLRNWVAQKRFKALVVVADPRTLGEFRKAYGTDLNGVLVAELDKDLTNAPISRIEDVLAQA